MLLKLIEHEFELLNRRINILRPSFHGKNDMRSLLRSKLSDSAPSSLRVTIEGDSEIYFILNYI
jgi:hypothetical protein